MKRIVYLCVMILLCVDVMAQIDLNEPNWEMVFYDDFTTNSWDTWNDWKITHPVPTGHYISYYKDGYYGITHGRHEHQVYQRDNCLFGNGVLKFVSVYEGGPDTIPLHCGNFDLPPNKICDSLHPSLYYSSGLIHTLTKFKYGYFEITCNLPIHKGSFPAFWLYSSSSTHYNEIDIFEYSWGASQTNHYKQFTCGLYCDNDHYPASLNDVSYARTHPILPNTSSDLTHTHVYACEWMPDHVTWYVDGSVVNEYVRQDSIPHHEMYLIANYAINNYAMRKVNGQYFPDWCDGDEMVVDSIRIFQLKTNCDTDVLITNPLDLTTYQPSVKKSIRIESSNEFTAPTNLNVSMRAVDSIVIGKGFTLPLGAQITLRTQPCPE